MTTTEEKLIVCNGSVKEPLQILHLEDNLADAALVEAFLETEQIQCEISVVSGRHDFHAALARPSIDLILSDFSIPQFDGLSALKVARKHRRAVPFIFLSGTIGEEMAVQALTEGATDYVLKDRMARLPAAIRRAISDVEAAARQRRAEDQLRSQAALLDLSQDAICLSDADQNILFWNRGAERLYGWTAREALGRNGIALLFQHDLSAPRAAFKSLIRKGTWKGDLHQVTKYEQKIVVESRWTLMRDGRGDPKSILIVNTDVTENRQLEAQLLRTQRLETIGALAGGIAHDLNNALTPISIGVNLLRDEQISAEGQKLLDVMKASTSHSVNMVRQILSFSRGLGGEHSLMHIQPLVDDILKFAQETFPSSIRIESDLQQCLAPIKGNATQLYQVLLNLCVNARDAMPYGGILHLDARNTVLDEFNLHQNQQSLGPHVMITVSDTGSGIPPNVLGKIFEPFFTTKEAGKGTGLGLSTVVGILKTHGGFVDVKTEIAKGSQFLVFLPVIA